MENNKVVSKTQKIFGKAVFGLKKHSPEILIAAGVVGVVTSAVLACKATLKIKPVLDKAKDEIDTYNNSVETEVFGDEYTEKDAAKDITIVYVKTGLELAKLYAPAVILGGLSLGSILVSNNILRKRNAALATAYAVLDRGYKEYRERVAERYGKEAEREIRYNVKPKAVIETSTDENGNETAIDSLVHVANPNTHSSYARFFDELCDGWEKDAELNLMFLRRQQRYANDLLQAKGYLFLNDVYDMLGIPRSKAGQVVGWLRDSGHDNYIDFGIYDTRRESSRDFVNGYERAILLDFNVDGYILDIVGFEYPPFDNDI